MQKIYYKETEITQLFTRGKWQHPDTGVKYPSNWNPLMIEGVVVINDPVPVVEPQPVIKTWTPLEFIEEFTDQEQAAVKTLAMSNTQIGLWYDKLLASQVVVANDERLLKGLQALVDAKVISKEKINTILA